MNKRHKRHTCGRIMRYVKREIFNNPQLGNAGGIHLEGWYVCEKCDEKIKEVNA